MAVPEAAGGACASLSFSDGEWGKFWAQMMAAEGRAPRAK